MELGSYLTAIRRAGYPCIYGCAPRVRPVAYRWGNVGEPRRACVERTKCDDRPFRRVDGQGRAALPRKARSTGGGEPGEGGPGVALRNQ
jgi:hypothetical protein